jgi:hypothetical protein
MAQVTVTVNGKPLKEFVERERNREIECFFMNEIRSLRRISHRPIVSAQPVRSNQLKGARA